MVSLLLILALTTCILWLLIAVELASGDRKLGVLEDVTPDLPAPAPKVSIIIPARNEERNIQAALQSVLGQEYRNLEFIVIDDRSTDGTASILANMAGSDPRLRVHTITQLPPGWLGKNHALDLGARHATGELLLFTDADVVMHRSAVQIGRAHV